MHLRLGVVNFIVIATVSVDGAKAEATTPERAGGAEVTNVVAPNNAGGIGAKLGHGQAGETGIVGEGHTEDARGDEVNTPPLRPLFVALTDPTTTNCSDRNSMA